MKYSCVYLMAIFLMSCKGKNVAAVTKKSSITETFCPENGICVFKSFTNKTLQINKSDLGEMYLEVIEGENLVVTFEYKKQRNKSLADSGYREEVFMELPTDNLELNSTDLADKKIYFARWCYCKGQTGYYKVNEGMLSMSMLDEDNLRLHLKFKINEVPQVITEINKVFSVH